MLSAMRLQAVAPFRDAAECWFWYCRALRAAADGWSTARWRRDGPARPCELSDVVAPVVHMMRRGELRDAHLAVLHRYGVEDREPIAGHTAAEDRDAALWREALDGLAAYWRGKGMIEDSR